MMTRWQYSIYELEELLRLHWKPRQISKTYRMVVDFGKYGKRVSYGRFTCHPIEEVQDRLVLGVLNFAPRQMGPVTSEVLVLGVQYPKAERGEAMFVAPVISAKIGSKLF
jgi:tRNA-binding protein